MKKLTVILLLLGMLLMCACGGQGDPGSGPAANPGGSPADAGGSTTTDKGGSSGSIDAYTIKIGHSDTVTNLIHLSLENFAKYVSEQTGGQIKVEIYAAEQLGSNAEMSEMVSMGNLDAMMMPNGQLAVYAPKVNILGLPFLFASYDQVYAVLDSEVGKSLVSDLQGRNMIQLSYWENGLRQVTNNARPIEQPSDLQGLKIRTPEDNMTLAIFNALGASPSPLAFSELYLALQQGTFDGQENPVSNIYANNFQDVQDYLTITNHKYEPKSMIFSLKTWNKFTPEVQNILLEGAKIYGAEHRKAIVDSADQMLADLEAAGMQVSRPDTSAFQEATSGVYDDFFAKNDWAEPLYNQIQEIINGVG